MHVKSIDYTSPSVAQDFCNSLRKTGFVVVTNHPIPQDLIETVYQDWEKFFQADTKFDYLFDSSATRQGGYFPFASETAKDYTKGDLKEFYHYRDEKDFPQGMGKSIHYLLEKMKIFGEEVLKWIEDDLPLEVKKELSMPLHQMIYKSEDTLIRILHYPPLKGNEEHSAVRAAPHEDIDLLTILPAATSPGLQVLDSQGIWHDISCDYGALVFNAGDMLQMITKGYYKSTTHRVVNPVGKDAKHSRYSLPLFLHPRSEVRLSDTHTAGSYLAERLRELGLKPKPQAA